MRIDKILSNFKLGSRSEIKQMIKEKRVKINDLIITDSAIKVDIDRDKIILDDKVINIKKTVYLALNKPKGFLSANKDNMHETLFSLIKEPYSNYDLNIAGRLDLDSEGLVILTNDGAFIHEIKSPSKSVNKVYEVTIDNKINDYEQLLNGVIIKNSRNEDFWAVASNVIKLDEFKYQIAISEGKFHQVKRMFNKLGTNVVNLKRISIGKLELKDLKVGEYIEIEREDVL